MELRLWPTVRPGPLQILLVLISLHVSHCNAQEYNPGAVPSRCPGECRTHGTCHEELGRCDCPKNRIGPDCSQLADSRTQRLRCRKHYYPTTNECVNGEQSCMNACNQRGACIAGFCHCSAGYYGADCSLSLDAAGKPELLAGLGYVTRKKRPWVYIYELPPDIHTWTNNKRLDRPTHNLFYQRLLGSGARIADGDQADWFFIPVRARFTGDSDFMMAAIAYIKQAYPWWNKYSGARHFVIHTGDLGAFEMSREARKALTNSTWLTHWGLFQDKPFSGWKAAHRPNKDVVIPVFVSNGHFKQFGMDRSPMHPLTRNQHNRTQTFFFAGRVCGDRKPPKEGVWPNCGPRSKGYSAGVRQLVHAHHWNRTGFRVVDHEPRYGHHLLSTNYCLAPLGGGHGQRQILVSFMGCIPVSIGDDVYEPFEPQIDWDTFAVKPAESEIAHLHTLLAGISPDRLAAKQAALKCAAQHFVYSTITGGFMGETGKYDAFESTLEVLRVKLTHPNAGPSQYMELDQDFKLFMNCGAEVMGGPELHAANGISSGSGDASDGDTRVAVCSHSAFDGHPPPCEKFVIGSSRSHGIPGGIMCAKSYKNLAQCPRLWA